MREAKPKLEPTAPPGLLDLLTHPVIGSLLLAAITLLVYWPVQTFDFITLDDPLFITKNPVVQAGFSGHGLQQALVARTGGIWQPITTLTYLLDVSLFGQDPAGPHLVNLLWHIASSVLLFLVFREMTGASGRSLLVAALFALHPMHVESVAWVAERKDVVSTCLGLLTLGAYARYAASARPATNAPSESAQAGTGLASPHARHHYLLALVCFTLGLLSKPMLVTLPCLFLLLDYWPLERLRFDARPRAQVLLPLVKEKLPFLLLSAVSCALTVWTQQEIGAVQPLSHYPLSQRLANTLVSYARYLGKLVWPTDLAVPYPSVPHWPWVTVAYAAALLAGLSALALWLARRQPFVLTGWLWFLGTLVPVIGLVQVGDQSLADRYTYLPYVGLFLVLSWGAGAFLLNKPALRTAASVGALALVGACALLTRGQLRYWPNSETLFTHTLAVTQDNWLACFSLGTHMADKERNDEAIGLYERALQVQPESAALLSNLGAALVKTGRTNEALGRFAQALRVRPQHPLTHYRLANTLAALGRKDEAIAHYRLAIQADRNYPEAINNLAVTLFNSGRLDDAIEQFRAALRLIPGDANTHCNLASALALRHRWPEAAEEYVRAIQLQPDMLAARYGVARAFMELGYPDDAAGQLQEILRRDPGNTAARQQLEALQAAKAK